MDEKLILWYNNMSMVKCTHHLEYYSKGFDQETSCYR